MDNPDVVADLNCKNIKYKDFSMESINFHSEMESDSNYPSGFVNLKIDKGIWRNEKFDSGTLDISFSKNRMVVENCHFKSGDDYLYYQVHGFQKINIELIEFSLHIKIII